MKIRKGRQESQLNGTDRGVKDKNRPGTQQQNVLAPPGRCGVHKGDLLQNNHPQNLLEAFSPWCSNDETEIIRSYESGALGGDQNTVNSPRSPQVTDHNRSNGKGSKTCIHPRD